MSPMPSARGSDSDRALDRPRELRACLGDAEVQRIRHLRGEHPVRADHRRHVRRLDRDLEVAVFELLEQLDLLERRRDQRLGLVLLGERVEMLRERARVRADAHRNAGALGGPHHLLDLVRPADVPGVDADGRHAGVDRLEGKRGVEVDVRDDRDRREPDDECERRGVLVLRDGHAHDLAPRRRQRRDLRGRGGHVVRLRQRHRLYDDGRAAADEHVADADLYLAGHS